jgi:hypothetical protein
VSGTCSISGALNGISTSAPCNVANNLLTVTNPFGSGSYTAGGAALSFIFSTGGTNPLSARDAGEFTITFYIKIDTSNYAIEGGYYSKGIYIPTPSILTASVSSVTSYIAFFQPSSYTLSITPSKVIP